MNMPKRAANNYTKERILETARGLLDSARREQSYDLIRAKVAANKANVTIDGFGLISQPIGPRLQDGRALRDQSGRKETAMTEVDSVLDLFVEAEIKKHHATLIRQIVATGIIICLTLILIGLHG